MNWKATCTMSERTAFIEAWLSRRFTTTELCLRFGVSRKTGHKWINRFKALGMTGLEDDSRARHSQNHQTADAVVARILELKNQYSDWGPVTIRSALFREPLGHWPAASTVGEILKTHGLVRVDRVVRRRHKRNR